MFMLWAVMTLWILFVFDNTWLDHPIAAHNVQSLLVFIPKSPLEWVIVGSWIVPLLFVVFRTFYVGRLIRSGGRPLSSISLGSTGNMRGFDWVLIGLSFASAVGAWTTGSTALLLLSTIVTLGLSLNKFEHWYVG